jgi:ribosomal peptide maturation radical SAM protein 1
MPRFKACLVSLPWDYYQSPSIAIGCLAAYARRAGFAVDAFHFHLAAAALFDLNRYDLIAYKFPVIGEAFSAMRVMPERKERLAEYARKAFPDAEACADRMTGVLRILYESVDWSRYRLVGLSLHFAQLFSSLLFAEWIKRDHPEVTVILGGGSFSEKLGRSVLDRFPQVDLGHHGEGEEPFVALLDALRRKDPGFQPTIPGLIYREGGKVRVVPKKPLADLGGLPDPDYSHYFKLRNTLPALKGRAISVYLPVEMSRGCIHRCAFCNFNFQCSFRPRPIAEVAASVERLADRYRTNAFCLMALMIPTSHGEELFGRLTASGRDLRIFCESRAGLKKKHVRAMRDAGVAEVQIGLEALDTRLLRKMRKGTRLIDNLQIMKYSEELGLKGNSFIMLGFPTESQADVDRSVRAIDFASAYAPPSQVVSFTLREGSPVQLEPHKFGLYRVREAGLFSEVSFKPEEGTIDIRPEAQDGVEGIEFWYQDYRSRRKPRDYRKLLERIESWRSVYEKSRLAGHPPLYYLDGKTYLVLEDYRNLPPKPGRPDGRVYGRRSVLLEGSDRDLYLFCDGVRGLDEILDRFKARGEAAVRRALRRLVGEKWMFTEGGVYLSLAVRYGPAERRGAGFPWF